jgi:hypothetical protein
MKKNQSSEVLIKSSALLLAFVTHGSFNGALANPTSPHSPSQTSIAKVFDRTVLGTLMGVSPPPSVAPTSVSDPAPKAEDRWIRAMVANAIALRICAFS